MRLQNKKNSTPSWILCVVLKMIRFFLCFGLWCLSSTPCIWGMVNLNTSMDLHHQTVSKPHFYWTHPPTRWTQAVLNHFVLRPPLSRLNQKKGTAPKRIASNQRRKISTKPVASSSGPTIISDSIVHWFVVDKTTTSKLKSYVEKPASWMSWKCENHPLAAHCFNSNSCRSLLRENIPAVATSQVDPFFSKDGHPTSKSCPSAGGGQCFIGIACGKLAGSCTIFWPQRIPCWTGDL